MKAQRVYLAGPDVFFPDALAIGEAKKLICAEHKLEGVFPLDATLELEGLSPPEQGHRCFDAMLDLMDGCRLVIANLTPFRGPSMDVGTAVEIGYMLGQGKPVFGYTNVALDYAARVSPDGFFVEPFQLVDNLMVEGPMYRTGVPVIRQNVPQDEVYRSLEGFRLCVEQAVSYLTRATR
jgi:nucleoside 2-deoxyribosyltransferase